MAPGETDVMGENTTQSDADSSGPFHTFGDGGFDPTTGAYHARFDANREEDPVVAIVRAVAAVVDRDPIDMPQLYATVHTGALADVLCSSREAAVEVTFPYEGCTVTVTSDGLVLVRPPPD